MQSPALETWKRLRQAGVANVTVIDLYRLVAEPRGLQPQELPRQERFALAQAAMAEVWPGFEVTAGTERIDPIRLVGYDAAWPTRFDTWRGRIAEALGALALRIDHVGSTAVPGLPAKPILDIQVSVADVEDEAAYVRPLETLELQLRSRDRLHRYLRPAAPRPREVHVHVCTAGSEWEREHLAFRDRLRADPGARDRYAAAKLAAAADWADDGWAYTDAKSEVIQAILRA